MELASPSSDEELDATGSVRLAVEQVEADINRHQRLLDSPEGVLRRLREEATTMTSMTTSILHSSPSLSPLPPPPARLLRAARDRAAGEGAVHDEEREPPPSSREVLRERVRGMLMERGLLLDGENETGETGETDDDGDESASTSSSAGGHSHAPSLHFAADLANDGALPGEEGFGFATAADERWRGEWDDGEEEQEEEEKEEQPQPQSQQHQHQRKLLPSPRPLPPASRLSQLAKPKEPWRKASAAETAEEKEQGEAAAAAALHQRRRLRQRQQQQQRQPFSFLLSAPVEERLFAAAKRREQRLELLRQRASEEEVAGCPFAPRLYPPPPPPLSPPASSSRIRPPLHERAASLAAAAAARRLAASMAPPPFPFSPQKMSQRSREIVERAAEAEQRGEVPPPSPPRHSLPLATPLPPPFAPRINRTSECLVAGTTFEERQEWAARARAERLAAAAERAAAATLGTSKTGGRFFPVGAAAVLRRKKHGQIGAAVAGDDEEGEERGAGEEAARGGGQSSSSSSAPASSPSAALLRASAAAAKAAEAAAEAEAAARPFPLHSPALCPRSLVLAERMRAKKKKGGERDGGRRFENVAAGAAGAEAAEAAEREDWSPAAAAAAAAASSGSKGSNGAKAKRDPDAAILLAARARRASRAAEDAARALAAAAALERECSFRPRVATPGNPTASSSSVYRPPCAGRPSLASEVVPGAASHLQRAAKAREAVAERRRRAEVAFHEKPRARYVCTKPEPFHFSSTRAARGDTEGKRHARAVEEEEAKCPFRPDTRAAEDARLVRELLAS